MDKLSKENQEWLESNLLDGAPEWKDVVCAYEVETKLLKMESKLKQAKIDTINEIIEGFGSFNGYNAIDVLDYMLDTKEDLKQ